MRLHVLRLGHRPQRDKRITTHVGLTARALGAEGMTIAERDESVENTIRDVVGRFGGAFQVTSGAGWKRPIKDWKAAGGQVVHLTMYGQSLRQGTTNVLADGRDVLVVVGAEKVPADLYDMADHNIAVGNQPHSEVAAIALLLDRLRQGGWEDAVFPDAEVRVVPSERGKHVDTM